MQGQSKGHASFHSPCAGCEPRPQMNHRLDWRIRKYHFDPPC
jgi:hypothetical protein